MTNKVLNKFVSIPGLYINIPYFQYHISNPYAYIDIQRERKKKKKKPIVFFMVTSICVFYFHVCSKPTRGLSEAILLISINYFQTRITKKTNHQIQSIGIIIQPTNKQKKLFINVLNDVNKTLNIQ